MMKKKKTLVRFFYADVNILILELVHIFHLIRRQVASGYAVDGRLASVTRL